MRLELEAEDLLNCWIREIYASKIEQYEDLCGRKRHAEGLCLVSMLKFKDRPYRVLGPREDRCQPSSVEKYDTCMSPISRCANNSSIKNRQSVIGTPRVVRDWRQTKFSWHFCVGETRQYHVHYSVQRFHIIATLSLDFDTCFHEPDLNYWVAIDSLHLTEKLQVKRKCLRSTNYLFFLVRYMILRDILEDGFKYQY